MRNSGSFPRLLCAIAAFAASSLLARAQTKPAPDTIVFTNGDQLTGKLERAVGDSIIFKSEMAGEITVSLDKVKELRSNGSFVVLRKGADPTRAKVAPGALIFAGGNLTVASSTGQPETIPEKEVA
ncbi:MAG TPA: hypothetical protein VN678_07765, partial [Acidobacteriaceae bacterium]|nr:hypothetical protein [Acidobacteriaceae bacterium]